MATPLCFREPTPALPSQKYIAEFDADGDGTISYEEFIRMLLPKTLNFKLAAAATVTGTPAAGASTAPAVATSDGGTGRSVGGAPVTVVRPAPAAR